MILKILFINILTDTTRVELGKFITLNAYIRKQKRMKINELSIQLRK